MITRAQLAFHVSLSSLWGHCLEKVKQRNARAAARCKMLRWTFWPVSNPSCSTTLTLSTLARP